MDEKVYVFEFRNGGVMRIYAPTVVDAWNQIEPKMKNYGDLVRWHWEDLPSENVPEKESK